MEGRQAPHPDPRGVEIRQVGPDALGRYAGIPARFDVECVLAVDDVAHGLGGLRLWEVRQTEPYAKDYDACEGGGPPSWPRRFNVVNWGFFLAVDSAAAIGGAAVAFRSPEVAILGGRDDLAVLWDIRVHPDRRRQGIGGRLLEHAAEWARRRRCKQIKIETQNVNVPACRFYVRHGCRLGAIDRYGYAAHPRVGGEVMLIWYLDLAGR